MFGSVFVSESSFIKTPDGDTETVFQLIGWFLSPRLLQQNWGGIIIDIKIGSYEKISSNSRMLLYFITRDYTSFVSTSSRSLYTSISPSIVL